MDPIRVRLAEVLGELPPSTRVWVAYSGGRDSHVLLHALTTLGERFHLRLQAVHVDHALHEQSAGWAEHCRRVCDKLGVPLQVERVAIERSAGESLEAVARDARYQALTRIIAAGDWLVTAHHLDDQAETLLLALLRGSGVHGLAAMPERARLGEGVLWRPLLGIARDQLDAYALEQQLEWIDDPSNSDTGFDRNWLRQRLMPLLSERWPAAASCLARSAEHCAAAVELVDAAADDALAECGGRWRHTLSVDALLRLPPRLRAATLRHWFSTQGLPRPDSRHLARIEREVLGARVDANPLVAWHGCEVRRYRGSLFALAPLPPAPGELVIHWMSGESKLGAGLGLVQLLSRDGETLNPEDLFPRGLDIHFGMSAVRCRRDGRGHHRPLKKGFQDAAIPPWLRAYVPMLYHQGTLIAVADLWWCRRPPGDAWLRWSGHAWERFGLMDREPVRLTRP